jgi:hypothetical protein
MNSRLRRPAVALISTALAASVLGIAPAAFAAGGSISGTVTSAGQIPTDDVAVVAWVANGEDWDYAGDVGIDTAGDYLLDALEPGSYRISFESPNGTYAYEAYDDVIDFDQAETISVDAAQVGSIDADLALAGQIAGTVTDETGGPLLEAFIGVYAEVAVASGGTDWQYVSGAETDALGDYEVDRLPAGTYRVDFDAEGYQSEYYDDVPTLEGSEPVDVVGGDLTSGIDAALTEDATISGTVIDADGQPLPDTYVGVLVGDDYQGWTTTDTNGEYTVDGLAAGSYVVSFDHEDAVTEEYLYEYYDNAGEVEDADKVAVEAGDELPGIDAQLIAGEHDPVPLPPVVNVTPPTISGTPQVGSTLTASAGTWSPTPTLVEYYWTAGDELVQGGTSATYVPTVADLGKVISVYVYASAEGYDYGYAHAVSSGPVVAVPVAPVPTPTPTPTPAPVVDVPAGLAAIVAGLDVTGKPKVGKTVKVAGLDLVLRTAVTYKFQWFAGTKKIKKATNYKLKVLSSMKGKKLSVKVTAIAASTSKSVKLKVGKVR